MTRRIFQTGFTAEDAENAEGDGGRMVRTVRPSSTSGSALSAVSAVMLRATSLEDVLLTSKIFAPHDEISCCDRRQLLGVRRVRGEQRGDRAAAQLGHHVAMRSRDFLENAMRAKNAEQARHTA